MSIVMEVCFEPLDPASKRAAEYGVAHLLPPGFDEWFAQCVSRDIEARFKTAKPARAALERLLTGNDAIATQPIAAPSVATPTIEAPDLDIPAPKPTVDNRERERPATPEKKPEPPPPVSRPAPSRPSQPERIVIPPIKAPAAPRVVQTAPVVEESAGPPWTKIAIGVGVVLVALFVAQRFFWTKPPSETPPPPVASTEDKTVASAKPSVATNFDKCPAGMARLQGGELDPGKPIDAFCMDTLEVSVKAYAACVKSGKCTAAATTGNWTATTKEEREQRNQSCNSGRADRLEHPITCVDWSQAEAY
jgi:hypothetical protein